MISENRAKISVVTATYNAGRHLPRLIESLRNQSDKDFQWVVADGASTDSTVELLKSISDLDILISSQADFGIYDALNRAIRISSGDYYIVAGADDFFYDDAIANYRRAINQSEADIIAARAMYGRKHLKIKKGPPWLFSGSSFIAAHTLATAFRKNLHLKYGYYSRLYPIAADHFFVMKACAGGASRQECDFFAGEIGRDGVSSVDRVGTATEVFRAQVVLGRSVFIQAILLLIRLLRSN